MPIRSRSVDTYPSEYLEFLKQSAVKQVDIRVTQGWREAFRLRVELQSLRVALKRENHPLYPQLAKAVISIRTLEGHTLYSVKGGMSPEKNKVGLLYPEDRTVILRGAPRDERVLSAFHDAGILPETLEEGEDPLSSANLKGYGL